MRLSGETRMFKCRRCGDMFPKHSGENSMIYGGRVCPTCSHEIKASKDARTVELQRHMIDSAIKPGKDESYEHFEVKKPGMVKRLLAKFFRRRGVQ